MQLKKRLLIFSIEETKSRQTGNNRVGKQYLLKHVLRVDFEKIMLKSTLNKHSNEEKLKGIG